ncbi:FAD-dependent oxidoreductase [Heliobacterium undosum]|uniref:FAD-dependent oxidoreductase n=1 Tax=Heliomicrobium undosum TaxID=121734 RepID=A0A845L0Y1_9FIRM|nr:FAD-dependent oxidoreductase [Heliomicrobium undosum]MZP28599.1 FAD-dependent oxidoreductase [Heliomicrobium undosum]
MGSRRIVVIGGAAAGPKAAARARRLDEFAEVTIIQKEADLSMASCGYPYYVGGVFHDRNQLICSPTGVVRDSNFFKAAKNITALVSTEATAIDREKRQVHCVHLPTGETRTVNYDKLVIATGAQALIPPIAGTELKGVTTLHSLKDADYLRRIRDEGVVKEGVIVGGGLIGMEVCEALQQSGIHMTVVEMMPHTLTFLDWELASMLEKHVQSKAARVITHNGVAAFIGRDGELTAVRLQDGTELPCQLAIIAIGVKPNVTLARQAGLAIGERGGILVDEYMQTSDSNIYAAGDCVEVRNRITGQSVLAPLGDLANLQGRVAGQNVIEGNCARFPGTIQTGICKVFDYTAGATGLSEQAAHRLGYTDIITATTTTLDKPGFMGGKPIITKMVAHRDSRQILGVQCVGIGDVSRRIAAAALAVQGRFTVEDMINADLPYAPPFSQAIDSLITTAHVLENKLAGRMKGISVMDVKNKVDRGDDVFFLDVRGKDEFEVMRLGIGETLIPLGMLRQRLHELPADKDREIIVYCKISLRGYEAACILEANGWRNVNVMEGGVLAWPYAMEKSG